MLGGDVGTIDGWIVGGSDSASTRGAHQSSASAVRQRGRGRRTPPGRRRTTSAAAAVRRRARGRTSGASSRAGRAGGPFGGSITAGAASGVIYRLIRMFASLRYRAGRPRAAGSVYAPRFMVIGLHSLLSLCVKSAVCAVRKFGKRSVSRFLGCRRLAFDRWGRMEGASVCFLVSYCR